MSGAAVTIRHIFTENHRPFTAGEIGRARPQLKPSEISMALSYLLKQRYVTRTLIPNTHGGRRLVWQYTYHVSRAPSAIDANAINT